MKAYLKAKNLRITPRSLGLGVILVLFLFPIFSACGGRKSDTVKGVVDSINYKVYTRGVETLISDSGITRYKLIAEKWYVYAENDNRWYFPEGIYLEQFDTLFVTQASVEADTATYYQDDQLWRLSGHVKLLNRDGDRFFTDTLYWNQRSEKVYSPVHVRIEMSNGDVQEGDKGFEAKQDMSEWYLYSHRGLFNVDSESSGTSSDSTQMPSVQLDTMLIITNHPPVVSKSLKDSVRTVKSSIL